MFGAIGGLGAIGAGLSGLGGRKESRSYNKAAKKRTAAALGELTPEAMQAMISKLFTMYYGQMNPAMQAAMGGISNNLARSGGSHLGVAQQLRAGVPGQFANAAMGQAIPGAMNVASQRAGIQANTPFSVGPSGYGIMGDMIKQFLNSYGVAGGFGGGMGGS
jgi:hypothetical protein